VSAINALRSRGVERFVYATMGTITHPVPAALRGERLVLMNNVDPELSVTSVIPDDTAGGRAAVAALLEAGHSTGIWVVGKVLPHAYAGGRRLAGIKAALRKPGLRLAGHVPCGWWPDETRRAVTTLLEAGWWDHERPTAVIAMNDRAAMGVYQACAAAGLRIPQDLSVVSFDNSDLARWLHPALSSVDLPYFELGRRAMELLFEEGPARTHKLPMTVRARESVAAPARRRSPV